jgi:dolichyl-diphosphooligosaccharide--protein glycosyltransferase
MKRWFNLGIKNTVSKSFKDIGGFRLQMNHAKILSLTALLLILFVAFTIRSMPLRWEIPGGTVRLNEFDPYYQFSLTQRMVQQGLLSPYYPTPWINTQQWYPDGLDMSKSLPALPMLTAVLYDIVSFVGVNIDLMTFCAFIPVLMGTLCCLVLYFIGKDFGGRPTGLLAALFLALSPSFLQRTALGFFDTEVCGVMGLLLFMFTFLRAIDPKRTIRSAMIYSLGAALGLIFFIAGWGAAYFAMDLAVLFVFVLLLLKRYTPRLLFSYSIIFGVSLFVTINIPNFSLGYLTAGPVVPVAGMFLLLCLVELLRNKLSARTRLLFVAAVLVALVGSFIALWQFGYLGGIAGKFFTVLDPFSRSAVPLIESVAEHRVTAWGNIYYELGVGVLFFLSGLYFTLKNPTNKNVFLLIFGITSLYFAASMVRLLVIFAPAFSLLVAMGILGTLKPFYTLLKETPRIAVKAKRGLARVSKEYSGIAVFLIFMLVMTNIVFAPQNGGTPRVYGSAYAPLTITSSSLPIAPDQVPEWLEMLSYTSGYLNSSTVVCAWWDYGYWLSILGNVTTLADNATVNGTQIENIGFIFMANETQAMKMLEKYDAEYILVFEVIAITYASDAGGYTAKFAGWGDEGKWQWMARISGQANTRLTEAGFMDSSSNVSSWIDESAFANMTTGEWYADAKSTATIYKLMSWGKQMWCNASGMNYINPDETIAQPTYFKEAFFAGKEHSFSEAYQVSSQTWIVPMVCLFEIDWDAYYTDMNSAT